MDGRRRRASAERPRGEAGGRETTGGREKETQTPFLGSDVAGTGRRRRISTAATGGEQKGENTPGENGT
uniref:Uncharacterized protein n=1 Tax=Oryza rufipogon TaxID=4529 RepID=A0A0E0QD84_ORYRU